MIVAVRRDGNCPRGLLAATTKSDGGDPYADRNSIAKRFFQALVRGRDAGGTPDRPTHACQRDRTDGCPEDIQAERGDLWGKGAGGLLLQGHPRHHSHLQGSRRRPSPDRRLLSAW